MPYIDWKRLPVPAQKHLLRRMKERNLTEDDMVALVRWINTNPEVPEAEWWKDFGTFLLAGEGAVPKTFLTPDMIPKGQQVE